MKIRYAPLAVACALMVAASAQAAAVTYSFGGTVNTSDLLSVKVGDAFSGSFTFESTSVNLGSMLLNQGDVANGTYDTNIVINGTVNGHTLTSTSPCSTCAGVAVVDVASGFRDAFIVSSYQAGGFVAPISGDIDGFQGYYLRLIVSDSSGTVFSSSALPTNLMLSSFDGNEFEFRTAGGVVLGTPSYLTLTTPVPETSTSAMLALGLGAVAVVRRRKGR